MELNESVFLTDLRISQKNEIYSPQIRFVVMMGSYYFSSQQIETNNMSLLLA